MNRKAPSARLIAIPIVAAGLLVGSSAAGAYQEGTPVVPVETPAPPVVVETAEPGAVVETPIPGAAVETPEPATATQVPPDPESTPMPGGMAGPGPQEGAGGEPPTDEGVTVNAAPAPEPPLDGGETAKPAPRGRVSVRNVRRNVDEIDRAPNPAPVASDQGAPAFPAVVTVDPVVNQAAPDTGVAEAVSEPRTRPSVRPAGSTPRSAVTALPATGAGAPIEHGGIPVAMAASVLALVLAAGRLRRRGA